MAEEQQDDTDHQHRGGQCQPKLPAHLESEWLGVILHSIGDAVIAANIDGLVTFMNPVAESLTGWAANEAHGQPLETVFNIVNEETHHDAENPVSRALREGVVVGLANHTLLIARDGTERPISDSAAPIRDEADQVAGAVLVFRDVTEQRQTERERRADLDYADNIIATLRHPFLVLDNNLRVKSANRSFYDTFGVSPEETQEQRVYDLGNGQWGIPRLRTLLEDILPQNTSFDDFKLDHEFPAIGHRYVLLNARRIRREGDNADLILLGIEDVTERRQLEEERREIETRFTSLVKNISDHAIFELDRDGRIASWNVEAERILGYSEDEALGQHFSMIFTADDVEQGLPEEELRLARENGRAEDERWHKRKNGDLFWALGIVTPTHDPHGNHNGFSKILRDITDRKRMEEALNGADRRKDEFLAMLSHELRTPLAPILNAVQLIEQGGDDSEERRTACRVIERQVRHLKRLVDDLLEVSRVSTGRIHLQKAQVSLNEVVEQVVERLRPTINQHKQEISISTPQDPVWIRADAARLEQAIGNLLTNASKYNEVGGHVWVSLESEGDHATIRVRDDGIGIDPDFIDSIFALFTQSDKSLERTEGGMGIGLALVKNLVEMHQGTVEARSEGIGKGSEFEVRLPITSEQESAGKPDSAPSIEADQGSLRILVVDDSVDAAKMSAMLLRSWGHEVRLAHNGPDALHRAVGFQPDVILLDIGLPDMDGYEVARHVRQDARISAVRLIAITGYGQESDRKRSKEAGFDHHLVKPVESADLKDVLAKVPPQPRQSF